MILLGIIFWFSALRPNQRTRSRSAGSMTCVASAEPVSATSRTRRLSLVHMIAGNGIPKSKSKSRASFGPFGL